MIAVTRPAAPRIIAPFKPLDWFIPAWQDQSRIMLLTGSAGGGKSRGAGEKIHAFMKHYPGATGLILRKTRESLRNSSMALMDRTVVGDDPGVRKVVSAHRFEYDNGSMLVFGGMANDEQAEQIRSVGKDGKVDMIWMEEATQFRESDFNELLARFRGTAAHWRQIILTTNPDAPLHWINKRLIMGKQASVYYSGAKDNHYNPPDYIESLSQLTGVQYDRLVLGKWSQAEGVVYDNWTEDNVSEQAEYNPDWTVIWGVDDGYARGGGPGSESYHPRVFLLMNVTPQGGLHVFFEYTATGELPERSIELVKTVCQERGYKWPDVAYVDSSAAELQARLHNDGYMTMGATHPVSEGIKNVRRLICDGHNVRLLKVHPRCEVLISEVVSYTYDERIKVSVGELMPQKMNDHTMDALRYAAWSMRYIQQ